MMRRMRARFLARDLAKQPVATLALTVLLILSALLMSTGAIVMERLAGSIDQLFETAAPPHFLQMHRGDIDRGALDEFASEHPEIDSWLIEEMYGFPGSAITWTRHGGTTTGAVSGDLSDSLIDHLFVTQNRDFDLLLDGTGAAPQPAAGEIYLPVGIRSQDGLQPGDVLSITRDDRVLSLRVAGFVRDAQMASSFASSARFLVSEADFDELRALGGDPESIIEYRLGDPAEASRFQSAYEANAALPKNGQAVTFHMIRMINAISDGLVAAALVFASLLIIAIAFINLRFVVRGTLEDDVREIGALRGIGLNMREIRGLYLMKYRLITFVGCVVGGAFSPLAAGLLTSGIRTTYGAASVGPATIIAPLTALGLTFLLVLAICRGVLRKIGRIDVIRALVHGSTLDERAASRHARRQTRHARKTRLDAGGFLPLMTRLSLIQLRAERGRWALVTIAFALITVLITLPLNVLSTLESPRFVTYMGAPDRDLRSDLQFGDDLAERHRELLARMRADSRLSEVQSFSRVPLELRAADGTGGPAQWQSLPAEAGDYSDTSITFMSGAGPGEGEIAVSAMVAQQHDIRVGDQLELRRGTDDEGRFEARVSGIYADVTSGGRTAKLQDPDFGAPGASDATGYVVYADTSAPENPTDVAAEYREHLPDAATMPIREYTRQTLSYATESLRGAAVLAFVFGIATASLITALFLRLVLTREQRQLGTLGALGFSGVELAGGLRFKTLITMVAGIVLGIIATATLGEPAISAVFAFLRLGITELVLIPRPWVVWVGAPLALCAAGLLATVSSTRRLRNQDRTAWL